MRSSTARFSIDITPLGGSSPPRLSWLGGEHICKNTPKNFFARFARDARCARGERIALRRPVLLQARNSIWFAEHTLLCHLHPQRDARTWSDSYHATSFVLRLRFQSSLLHRSEVSHKCYYIFKLYSAKCHKSNWIIWWWLLFQINGVDLPNSKPNDSQDKSWCLQCFRWILCRTHTCT